MSASKENRANVPQNNKENIKGISTFHKSIDLKTSPGVQNNQENLQQQIDTQAKDQKELKKQNSYASIENNSRRFSLFSKTSFATSSSFLFGTKIFNKTSKSVPKVNICNIIKKKAYLYLDEALANTFDDLLDKGYELVTSKKDERDIMKEGAEAMRGEIYNLEREIVPLTNQINNTKESIQHQIELKEKYDEEINSLQKELSDLQNQIQQRVTEIQDNHNSLTNDIKDMEIQNNEIRSQININKAQHRQETNAQEKQRKAQQTEHDKLVIQLNEQKKQYDENKLGLADRLRKMENKSKMFIGILKH